MRNQAHGSISKGGWHGSLPSAFTSSWSIILFVTIAVVTALLIFIGIILYLAYGFSDTPPKNMSIPSSPSSATIQWHANDLVHIESDNIEGAYTALGVSHATTYPWQMHLWRQTAMGALTEWYGPKLEDMDRFTRRLRFSSLAKETFNALPEDQAQLLKAYTAGINAVLLEDKYIKQNELTLLNVTPDLWQPWQTLAVERLFAWLSLDLDSITRDSTGIALEEWQPILDDNRALKQWLQIHGFQYSMGGTWPADTLSTQTIFHRLVYGSSAIPFIQEAVLQIGNAPPLHTATIPGTLVFPSGQSANHGWFILPYSTAKTGLQPLSLEPLTVHERIQSRDGSETLVTLRHFPGWLLPIEEQSPKDSIPGLIWNGLTPGTDLSAFVNLLFHASPSFQLLNGDGLMTEGDSWSILGSPPYIHELNGGILIGGTQWSKYQASRLNTLLDSPSLTTPNRWPEECHNDWAQEHATFLLEEYLLRRISFDEEYADALTYLRNWDFTYTASSIGAIIFDSWIHELPDSLYTQVLNKELTPSDTLARVYLQQSITGLRDSFGLDLSKWRLDITKPISRRYPAWNADSLFSTDISQLSGSLFATLNFPGRGHAATLCWGSFQSHEALEISTRWESWSFRGVTPFTYQWRNHTSSNSFLGRYLISNSPSETYLWGTDQDVVSTTRINQ